MFVIYFARKPYPLISTDVGEQLNVFGETIYLDLQSPSPYPNSEIGRNVVWSETVGYFGDKSIIGIVFERYGIVGEINPVYEVNTYDDCDYLIENTPEGKTRERIDEDTIVERVILSDEDYEQISSVSVLRCGEVEELKFLTPQEKYDLRDEIIEGDFVVVKNEFGDVLSLFTGKGISETEGNFFIWSPSDNIDKVIIEIYADEKDNGFGLKVEGYIIDAR